MASNKVMLCRNAQVELQAEIGLESLMQIRVRLVYSTGQHLLLKNARMNKLQLVIAWNLILALGSFSNKMLCKTKISKKLFSLNLGRMR